MITLETGVPGAGKTLYCVDKLLRPLVGAVVKQEDENGQLVEVKRVIYSNINGLLLDHEKIGPDELNSWHKWAKPGSIIVYDEIQKPWPLAPSGSKVPDCIQALETHRHMGVDFIVLTQHPMLIHANVVRLVGRHLHVRRMGNMGFAVVYEWDSCSKTLLYKNALSKAAYKYSKAVFELYKSAEAHTKMPRKIPSLVYGVVIGLIGLAVISPTTFARIKDRISPPPVVVKAPLPAEVKKPSVWDAPALAPAAAASAARPSNELALALLGPPVPAVEVAGCASLRGVCRCYDHNARKIDKPAEFCVDLTTPLIELSSKPKSQIQQTVIAENVFRGGAAEDGDVLSWMRTKQQR